MLDLSIHSPEQSKKKGRGSGWWGNLICWRQNGHKHVVNQDRFYEVFTLG